MKRFVVVVFVVILGFVGNVFAEGPQEVIDALSKNSFLVGQTFDILYGKPINITVDSEGVLVQRGLVNGGAFTVGVARHTDTEIEFHVLEVLDPNTFPKNIIPEKSKILIPKNPQGMLSFQVVGARREIYSAPTAPAAQKGDSKEQTDASLPSDENVSVNPDEPASDTTPRMNYAAVPSVFERVNGNVLLVSDYSRYGDQYQKFEHLAADDALYLRLQGMLSCRLSREWWSNGFDNALLLTVSQAWAQHVDFRSAGTRFQGGIYAKYLFDVGWLFFSLDGIEFMALGGVETDFGDQVDPVMTLHGAIGLFTLWFQADYDENFDSDSRYLSFIVKREFYLGQSISVSPAAQWSKIWFRFEEQEYYYPRVGGFLEFNWYQSVNLLPKARKIIVGGGKNLEKDFGWYGNVLLGVDF